MEGSVFRAEIGLAAGHIYQPCSDKDSGSWLDPLFDPAAEVVPEIEKHSIRSKNFLIIS